MKIIVKSISGKRSICIEGKQVKTLARLFVNLSKDKSGLAGWVRGHELDKVTIIVE